jgi:hypothetical protein
LIQELEQVMSGQLHLLVPPFGCPVNAGDQPCPMEAAEVSIDERVSSLRLIGGAFGEPQVPFGIFVPGMRIQVGVLVGCTGLDLAPVAVENVLVSFDETTGAGDTGLIHAIRGHALTLALQVASDHHDLVV